MASRIVPCSVPGSSSIRAGWFIEGPVRPKVSLANPLSSGPCSSCKVPLSNRCTLELLLCKLHKALARNTQAALNLTGLWIRRNRLLREFVSYPTKPFVSSTAQNAARVRCLSAGQRGRIKTSLLDNISLRRGGCRLILPSAKSMSLRAVHSKYFSPSLTVAVKPAAKPAAVNGQTGSSSTGPSSGVITTQESAQFCDTKNPHPKKPQEASQETSTTASEKARASGLVLPSEPELVEFVKEFLDGLVGRRSVLPKVVTAARAAGLYLGKGELPAVLKKHPEIFEYNPANQYVQLRRTGSLKDKGTEALSFAEREKHFIDFLLALLQERAMPSDGLFFCWVIELAKHRSSGVNQTGLPRPTRMVSRHLDLFDIDGYGTAMVRVKLTEQGRLRTHKPLPREFRLYLRSDEAQRYRDGVWIGEVDRKAEMEDRAQALTEEELAVVLFLVRAVHAKGPGTTYKFLHLGQLMREAGITVRGKAPKLVNIVMKSREVFDVHELGTPHVAVSLTQEGWDAAEKLPPTDVTSAVGGISSIRGDSVDGDVPHNVEGTGPA